MKTKTAIKISPVFEFENRLTQLTSFPFRLRLWCKLWEPTLKSFLEEKLAVTTADTCDPNEFATMFTSLECVQCNLKWLRRFEMSTLPNMRAD